MKDDEEGERQEGLMDRSGGVVAAKEAQNGMNRSHWASSAVIGWFLAAFGGERFAQGATLDSSENA